MTASYTYNGRNLEPLYVQKTTLLAAQSAPPKSVHDLSVCHVSNAANTRKFQMDAFLRA